MSNDADSTAGGSPKSNVVSEQSQNDLPWLDQLLESEFDQLQLNRLNTINDGFYGWIRTEHTLIGNRMGWFVAANAFLLTPVALLFNDGQLTLSEKWMCLVLCAIGLVLSVLTFLVVNSAIKTLRRVLNRQTKFLDKMKSMENLSFHLFDPDRNVGSWAERRKETTHDRSMWFQLGIPITLLVGWCLVTLIVVFTPFVNLSNSM